SHDKKHSVSVNHYIESIKNDKLRRNKWVRLEMYYMELDNNRSKAKKYLEEALVIDVNFRTAVIEKANIFIEDSLFLEAIYIIDIFLENNKPDAYIYYLNGF